MDKFFCIGWCFTVTMDCGGRNRLDKVWVDLEVIRFKHAGDTDNIELTVDSDSCFATVQRVWNWRE